MDDWYCDSNTTYTIFMVGRPRTSSGTIRRFSALEAVKPPMGPLVSVGSVTTCSEVVDGALFEYRALVCTACFWIDRGTEAGMNAVVVDTASRAAAASLKDAMISILILFFIISSRYRYYY